MVTLRFHSVEILRVWIDLQETWLDTQTYFFEVRSLDSNICKI